MLDIFFVTGNQHKFQEASHILSGLNLKNTEVDIIEIQGEIKDIAINKVKEAFKVIKKPCFIEDTSLCFDAWGNLPGPYIKPFLHEIGSKGLAKALMSFSKKGARAICTVAYLDRNLKEPKIFQGIVKGKITAPKGKSGFEWDQIFIPTGYKKTFAELGMEVKNKISHRKKALTLLNSYLISR